jgi:hypothetical protein
MTEFALQDDLFSARRWCERRTTAGTSVRLLLEPLDPPHVRVCEYHRQRAGSREYRRVPEEEGRVHPLERLLPGEDFAVLFGELSQTDER